MLFSEWGDRLKILFQKSVPYIIFLLISFLVTLVFFSNLLTRNHAGNETALELSEAIVETGDIVYDHSALQIADGGGKIRFENLSIDAENITIIFQATGNNQVQMAIQGSIYLRDDGNRSEDVLASSFTASPAGRYKEVTSKLQSKGQLRELEIAFLDESDVSFDYEVTGIVMNTHEAAQFNFLLLFLIFILLTALNAIRKYKLYQITCDPQRKRHKRCIQFVVALNILIVCTLGFCLKNVSDSGDYLNYYEDLVQSFDQIGTIEVPYEPPEGLLNTRNPYDSSLRIEEEIDFPWDMAYYNGNYYVYFGVAPVILIYLPFYLITGQTASPAFVATLLMLLAVIGLGPLLMEMIRKFRIQANLLMLLLLQFTLPFCTLLYVVQASADMYYIALLCGIASLIWFFLFSFWAMREKHPVRRRLLFAAAGAACVIVAGSRPNLLIFGLAIIPLYTEVLLEKQRYKLKKALDAVVFFVPILIGAAGLMYYNYIRFDSFLEFGSTYQLTISDIRYNQVELSAQNFVNTLLVYFFHPLSLSPVFPYASMTRPALTNLGNYFYSGVTVGVFSIPYYLSLLLFPFVKFRNRTEKGFIVMIVIAAFVLAYLDYCIGGAVVRYVCDLLVPLGLVAAVFVLKLLKPGQTGMRYYVCVGIISVSLMIGVSLIFTNERSYFFNLQADLYIIIKNLFSINIT